MEQKKTNKRVTEIVPFKLEEKKKTGVSRAVQAESQAQRTRMEKKEDPLERFHRMQL